MPYSEQNSMENTLDLNTQDIISGILNTENTASEKSDRKTVVSKKSDTKNINHDEQTEIAQSFTSRIQEAFTNTKNSLQRNIRLHRAKKELLTQQVTCLYCFSRFDRNDVLFRKHDGTLEYDIPLYKQIYSINSDAIALKQKKIVDWHHYHQDSLVVKNGIIEAIWDYDNEKVTEKICPFCHFPLEDLSNTVPLKITAVSCNEAIALSQMWENFKQKFQIPPIDEQEISIKVWKKEYGRFSGFSVSDSKNSVHTNLILFNDMKIPEQDREKLSHVCDYSILVVKSDLNGKNLAFDEDFNIKVTEFISDFIKKYGDENSLFYKSLAICIDTSSEEFNGNSEGFDFSKFMVKYHTPLINFLNNHCVDYSIFPINLASGGADGSGEVLVRWILGKSGIG